METFDHVPGNEKDQVSTNMQIMGRILETSRNGLENGRKSRKGTQQRVNEFFANLPPKTLTSMQYNDLLPA